MGYTLVARKTHHRVLIFGIFLASLALALVGFFPAIKKVLTAYSLAYYTYRPAAIVQPMDTSALPPAVAVPVLMYHGVIKNTDDSNTTIQHFIADMEMLKRNGYQSITVAQLDQFYQGIFTLPPKPIVITFDDGRKDSYYTTDDILKKLGYSATIFVASGPTIDGNSFYLTFDELKKMKATGRWEIEAHGRYSHRKIPIVKNPSAEIDYGRYLTSKVYLAKKGRLETDAEFKKRVENDYINSINDLRTNVGVTSRYFAIPLNDYGQQPISNYDQAVPFNEYLIKKYFNLAFIQANNSDNVLNFSLPPYNFKSDNPYRVKRIEMKNMSAADLLSILEKEAPVPPRLALSGSAIQPEDYDPNALAGIATTTAQGFSIQARTENYNGQVLFGKPYWQNYAVTAQLQRVAGRSAVLIFDYKDSKNYMSFGLTDNGYFLTSTVNDVRKNIRTDGVNKNAKSTFAQPFEFKAEVKNGTVNCYFNGKIVYANVPIPLSSGEAGVKVWDNTLKAQALVKTLRITPL